MSDRHKLLLLDDDQDLLELYREILARLPSQPEIHLATSGARAISLLESEPFSLLISDLNMPKMDGLQVLSIVRRKFPELRTAVMTSVVDEQFRTRAYSMGIDLYLEKPNSSKEITFFLDCIESLLGRERGGGFRGVQDKSLVDIIQLECLSQSSSVLKVVNGGTQGKVWFLNGDIIDAEFAGTTGQDAFQKILGWKAGNFEILPAEPDRTRTIFASYQGLLLASAQAIDEAGGAVDEPAAGGGRPSSVLGELAQFNGVELLISFSPSGKNKIDSWGAENPEQVAEWAHQTVTRFRELGETLKAGALKNWEGLGSKHHFVVAGRGDKELCVGFARSLSHDIVRSTMKNIVAKWAS